MIIFLLTSDSTVLLFLLVSYTVSLISFWMHWIIFWCPCLHVILNSSPVFTSLIHRCVRLYPFVCIDSNSSDLVIRITLSWTGSGASHVTGDMLRGICAGKNTLWAIVNPNRGVNWMTSWLSDFCAFAPSHLMNLRWCRQVLEPDNFFCTLVRTDVMMHNRAAEVSSTAVRGGFDRFLMTPWMACQNP